MWQLSRIPDGARVPDPSNTGGISRRCPSWAYTRATSSFGSGPTTWSMTTAPTLPGSPRPRPSAFTTTTTTRGEGFRGLYRVNWKKCATWAPRCAPCFIVDSLVFLASCNIMPLFPLFPSPLSLVSYSFLYCPFFSSLKDNWKFYIREIHTYIYIWEGRW